MSKMQKGQLNQSRKKSTGNWTGTALSMQILLPLLLSVALITAVSATQAEALKIIIKFKYSDFQKHHPSTLKKMNINAYSDIDQYYKELSLSKLPKTKTINMDVEVGKEFTVGVNSYYSDDGNANSGINGPEKEPEKITVKVP